MSEQGNQWEVTYTTQSTENGCETTVTTGDGKTRKVTGENCEEVQAEVQQYVDNPGGSGSASGSSQPRKRFFGIF